MHAIVKNDICRFRPRVVGSGRGKGRKDRPRDKKVNEEDY